MKAILLTEIPVSCEECVCADNCEDHVYCQVNAFEIGNRRERPKWCPLKPMPIKVSLERPKNPEEYTADQMFHIAFCEGWNACLDTIEGETE